MNERYNKIPDDPKIVIFSHSLKAFQKLPNWIVSLLKTFLLHVSPDISEYLSNYFKDYNHWKVFRQGFIATLVFCIGGSIIISLMNNTLYGTDPNRVYLSKDYPNLINYILICPLYVGLGLAFTTIHIREVSSLKSLPIEIHQAFKSQFIPKRTHFGILFVALLISFLSTISYMHELQDPSVYKKAGWYFDYVSPDGARYFGAAGSFYVLLNFCLIFISLISLSIAIANFFRGVNIGNSLRELKEGTKIDFKAIKERLASFTLMYLFTKLLVAIYMLNAFTWRDEISSFTTNSIILGGVLTFFGVVFISIPRLYLELQWFQFKYATTSAEFKDEFIYEDSRDSRTKMIVYFLDSLIIGGFIFSYWF